LLYLIIIPIYYQTGDGLLAWRVAVAACFIGGVIEVSGVFLGGVLENRLPKSALLANMTAGAFVWLAFNGIISVYDKPIMALFPLLLLMIGLFGKPNLKYKLNYGLIGIIIGTFFAWYFGYMSVDNLANSFNNIGFYPPQLAIKDVFIGISKIKPYLSIIIPLQLANVITTVQGVRSAEAVGDRFPLKISLAADGLSTIVGACFGNPFPTTVYWGHPGWKKLGARSGYSLLVALFYTTCFFGVVGIFTSIIPFEVAVILLVYVGVASGGEGVKILVSKSGKDISPVVFMSLIPLFAQFVHSFADSVLSGFSTSIAELAQFGVSSASGACINGLLALSQGAFLSSLLFSVWIYYVIENEFKNASYVSILLAISSFSGLIHTSSVEFFTKEGMVFGGIYMFVSILCLVIDKGHVRAESEQINEEKRNTSVA